MSIIYLHLGSNRGDRVINIENAYALIQNHIGEILTKSHFYETEPWGEKEQDAFINSAIKVNTTLSPFNLLKKIGEVEKKLGREKTIKWGPRKIDIDIIFYDDIVLLSSDLTIPHVHYMDRLFVLRPLLDIAPAYNVPLLLVPLSTIANNCKDTGQIHQLKGQ